MSINEIILKYNDVFGLYCQIDLYRMDSIYILVTQVDSRLEIAKKLSTIVLTYPWSTVKYEIFAFFPSKNEKLVHDSVVIGSHL